MPLKDFRYHLLSIGVNREANGATVRSAERDAFGISWTFAQLGYWRAERNRCLTGAQATPPAVEAHLSSCSTLDDLDLLLLFWSGHLGDAPVVETLAAVPSARLRVLIVDTCHAGRAEGSFDSHSLMKRSASSLFPLIVASKGEEKSQEYAAGKHGLFTYALMNALAPDADSNGDLLVSLREAFRFAVPIVEELRDKAAGGQTPQMVVPQVLDDVALVGTDR